MPTEVPLEKESVIEALRQRLAADLATLIESQQAAQAGSVHPETKSEGSKDTRATEASYLARGLAERVEQLQDAARILGSTDARAFSTDAPIAVGALVRLESDDGAETLYYLSSVAGGVRLDVAGAIVTVVTSHSPVGQALLGQCRDDEIEFRTPKGPRRSSVVAVW